MTTDLRMGTQGADGEICLVLFNRSTERKVEREDGRA